MALFIPQLPLVSGLLVVHPRRFVGKVLLQAATENGLQQRTRVMSIFPQIMALIGTLVDLGLTVGTLLLWILAVGTL